MPQHSLHFTLLKHTVPLIPEKEYSPLKYLMLEEKLQSLLKSLKIIKTTDQSCTDTLVYGTGE